MFSKVPRCIYTANQLVDVICQLRFPEILSINTESPAAFQEAIRDVYPLYSVRKEIKAPKFQGTPGAFHPEDQSPTANHQFASGDGVWRVNLTGTFISLSCSRYTRWEDFAKQLDYPLAAFIRLYKPAFFQRVGLRYVNFISRSELDMVDVPFSQLIRPCYLGILGEPDVAEQSAARSTVDTELAIRGGCRVKIHAGPGLVKRNGQADKEVKFIFDQDLYMPGSVPVNLCAGALETLHSQAFSIFRGAITDTLHHAMEPAATD